MAKSLLVFWLFFHKQVGQVVGLERFEIGKVTRAFA